ncbi:MAG: HEAT repeat domain-containing protein, partial [Phycisphaerae bacterium]|jgi:HEAT repeat protein|nr:HEAT repeat domain-containing protein [Phycisphaerae bacterium]
VRWRIAEALGEIRDARAIVHLIKALRDSDRYVRIDAAKALIRITGQNFGQDQEKWKEWWAMTRK